MGDITLLRRQLRAGDLSDAQRREKWTFNWCLVSTARVYDV
jgi:hypothetical protein